MKWEQAYNQVLMSQAFLEGLASMFLKHSLSKDESPNIQCHSLTHKF